MKELIILVGMPGSGKSTYCNKELPGYFRISQDDHGKEEHKALFMQALNVHNYIVVDRCNFNRSQRARYIKPAREAGYNIKIVVFQADYETCIKRIMDRPNHPNLHSDLDEHKIREVVSFFRDATKEPAEDEYDDLVYI